MKHPLLSEMLSRASLPANFAYIESDLHDYVKSIERNDKDTIRVVTIDNRTIKAHVELVVLIELIKYCHHHYFASCGDMLASTFLKTELRKIIEQDAYRDEVTVASTMDYLAFSNPPCAYITTGYMSHINDGIIVHASILDGEDGEYVIDFHKVYMTSANAFYHFNNNHLRVTSFLKDKLALLNIDGGIKKVKHEDDHLILSLYDGRTIEFKMDSSFNALMHCNRISSLGYTCRYHVGDRIASFIPADEPKGEIKIYISWDNNTSEGSYIAVLRLPKNIYYRYECHTEAGLFNRILTHLEKIYQDEQVKE